MEVECLPQANCRSGGLRDFGGCINHLFFFYTHSTQDISFNSLICFSENVYAKGQILIEKCLEIEI